MATWTTPKTWGFRELARSADMNTYVSNNLQYLYDRSFRFALFGDQKADGTNGGNTSAGTWHARDLNTEFYDPDGLVALASNRFTLISGTYYIEIETVISANGTTPPGSEFLRIYNFTQATVQTGLICINQAKTNIGTNSNNLIFARGYITANGTDSYRIDMWGANTLTNGLGTAQAANSNEVYTTVRVVRIGDV